MPKYLTTIILILACGLVFSVRSSFLIAGNGFFDFLIGYFYKPILVGCTLIAVVFHTGPYWNPKLFFLNLGIGLLSIALFSLFLNRETFSKIDWHINKEKREAIVDLVKQGHLLNEKIPDSLELCLTPSPSEFRIKEKTDSTVTILFYTDFGLLDHYSGFIYSDDKIELKRLNEQVLEGRNDFKISPNWFEIND